MLNIFKTNESLSRGFVCMQMINLLYQTANSFKPLISAVNALIVSTAEWDNNSQWYKNNWNSLEVSPVFDI